jgi:hypothetical protein
MQPVDEKDEILAKYLSGIIQSGLDTRCSSFPLHVSVCTAKELSAVSPRTRVDRFIDVELAFFSDGRDAVRQQVPLSDLLMNPSFARTILLGAAGVGKTLFAQQVAYGAAQACWQQLTAPSEEAAMAVPPVPLLVSVLDMIRIGTPTVAKFIQGTVVLFFVCLLMHVSDCAGRPLARYGSTPLGSLLLELLEFGALLVVLDEFDVCDTTNAGVSIRGDLTEHMSAVRRCAVCTCRRQGGAELGCL